MKTTPLLALLSSLPSTLGTPPPHRRQTPSPPSIQAGAIISSSSSSITSITGTFRVPHLSIPISGPFANRQSGIYAYSIWIGIGSHSGYGISTSCTGAQNGVLRAGIDVFYDGFSDTPMTPFAWYEGGTKSDLGAFAYAGFDVQAGDLVRITVSAEAGEGGKLDAVMERFGQVEAVEGREAVQRERPTYGLQEGVGRGLCRGEARWVVEGGMTEMDISTPVVMANFTEVRFRDMKSTGGAGEVKVVDLWLDEQGGRLSECTKRREGEVGCLRI